jgi:hypothetical protein
LLISQQMSIIGAMPADKLERIGVVVNRVTGVDSVISAASQAEALGYGTAWLTNDGIPNIRFPSYQRMLVRAGLDEAVGGVWTDKLVDEVIVWGPAPDVAVRIRQVFEIGADEVLIRPIGAGAAPDEVIRRTVGSVAAEVSRA